MPLYFKYHPNIFYSSNAQHRTRMPAIAGSSIPMTLTIKWDDGFGLQHNGHGIQEVL